jgi:hypothetical protein
MYISTCTVQRMRVSHFNFEEFPYVPKTKKFSSLARLNESPESVYPILPMQYLFSEIARLRVSDSPAARALRVQVNPRCSCESN